MSADSKIEPYRPHDPFTREGRERLRFILNNTAPAHCTHALYIAFEQALDLLDAGAEHNGMPEART